MKTNFTKKTVSIILAIALIAIPVFSSMAVAIEKENYPMIHIPGIMASDIYSDVNDPNSDLVWPPKTDSILTLVEKCIPALLEVSITKDWDKLGKTISPLAYELFADCIVNKDGSIPENSGVRLNYPTKAELINRDNYSVFNYDWRANPLETAQILNDYIDHILEVSGSDKVVIECHSLGGIITLAYCSLFGIDKIDAIALNSTAINGETYTGELLLGDIILSNDSLMSFMDFVFDATEQEKLLSCIFDILEKAGLGEFVADLGNTLLENLSDILIPEVVLPLFSRWLTIWAMVPDSMIDDAIEYTFSTYYSENDADALALKNKIIDYNNVVRANKSNTLQKLDDNCKIGVISRYGYSAIPATSSWREIGDGVIDTKFSSFGATVALYGSTLDDDIINSTAPEFISPDKTIDASTALFADRTWFVKGLKHSNLNSHLDKLVKAILYSDSEITVDTLEEFPRYLVYDFETDLLLKDNGESNAQQTGIFAFFAKIKAFISDFMEKLRKFFGIIK